MATKHQFDVPAMKADMASKGWLEIDLAKRAGCHRMTVARFLSGQHQTARQAKKIAEALGHDVRHYLISDSPQEVAS